MKKQRPPPEPRLGPLSTDVTQRILLMLPWLDRVRAEGVCRGWLACLRAAPCAGALDSATALAQCRAAGLPMRRNAAGRQQEAVVAAALRLRAGDARAFRIADDVSLRTLLVPPPERGVDSLSAWDVSAAALNCAFDALDGARVPLPARLRLQRVMLSDATGLPECEALRLLTRPVAAQLTDAAVAAKTAAASPEAADATAAEHGAAADAAFASAADAAQLHIRLAPAFLKYDEGDDDGEGDDARVVRCARLGRALARQAWPRVSVELFELDDSLTEEGGSAALATLLEVCFSAMQDELDVLHLSPLALDRRCVFDLRKSNAMLDVPDARRVARAAPPHVTLFFAEVLLDSFQDADALALMLGAGRVAGAEISLRNFESVDAPLMSRVAAALSAAAAADGSDFALDLGGNTALKMVEDAHVFSSLRGLTALRGLCVFPDSASMLALLSVLPPSLRSLTLRGSDLTDETPLLVAAMLAGQLPSLEYLRLYNARLKDGESARQLASFLRSRSAPFRLNCDFVEDARAWDVLTALLKSAPPSSGVPAYAASVLRSFSGPMLVEQLPELVTAVFAALQHDSEACVLNSDTFALQVCQPECGAAAFAGLLLHLYNRAPAEMTPLLSSPQRVLLVAARVLRARSQLAAPEDLLCTPLLHRMLLIAAGGTIKLPVSALRAVAAACKHDKPADPDEFAGTDEELEQHLARINESRWAHLTLLLACALAREGGYIYPAFATPRLLAHRTEWLLESVPLFCCQAANPSAGTRFLGKLRALGVVVNFTACDAALHLWALSRISSLTHALWNRQLEFCLGPFLETSWLSKMLADPASELRLFQALDGLLAAGTRDVLEQAVVHARVAEADSRSGWFCVLDADALSAKLSSLEQRRDAARANSPAAVGALAVACSYVASILRRYQEALASPPVAEALRLHAMLGVITSPTLEPSVWDCAARELNRILLQWMRAGTPRAVKGSFLLPHVTYASLELFPDDWASLSSPPLVLAQCAVLACCLTGRDETLVCDPGVCLQASKHISVLLRSILAMHASAVAADPGCESFIYVAHLLLAAGDVFSRCSAVDKGACCSGDFSALVGQLLTAGWMLTNSSGALLDSDAAAETAAAAYKGLAQLLDTVNTLYGLQALSVHLHNGAPALLDLLGGELMLLAQLRCRPAGGPADQRLQRIAVLDEASAKLHKLLRVLHPVFVMLVSNKDEPLLTPNAAAALANARLMDI